MTETVDQAQTRPPRALAGINPGQHVRESVRAPTGNPIIVSAYAEVRLR
jgi:hypothetical protein